MIYLMSFGALFGRRSNPSISVASTLFIGPCRCNIRIDFSFGCNFFFSCYWLIIFWKKFLLRTTDVSTEHNNRINYHLYMCSELRYSVCSRVTAAAANDNTLGTVVTRQDKQSRWHFMIRAMANTVALKMSTARYRQPATRLCTIHDWSQASVLWKFFLQTAHAYGRLCSRFHQSNRDTRTRSFIYNRQNKDWWKTLFTRTTSDV